MRKGIRIAVYILTLLLALVIEGVAENRAFIWDSTSGMRDVPVHPNIYSYDAFSYPEAINNHGEVVGWGPYAWKWNSITGEIGSLPFIFPADINDHGETVGSSSNNNGGWIAYLSNSTGLTDLGKLPGDAWASPSAINNSGQVVGYSGDGAHGRPFIWDKTNGMRLLALPLGFVQGYAYGINEFGVVAGKVTRADWTDVAVYWGSPTDVHILGATGEGDRSEAFKINSSGQVVGRMRTASTDWHACIWDPRGNVQVLGTLPECYSSEATAINDKGQVAGTSQGDGISKAFMWDSANGMRDLGDWDGNASYAVDINNNGQICGWYYWQKYVPCSIGEAKRLPYETCVEIKDAVVVGENPRLGFFIESVNRVSGMPLMGAGFSIGQRLTIHGVTSGNQMGMYQVVGVADGMSLAPLSITSSSLRPELFDPEGPRNIDMEPVPAIVDSWLVARICYAATPSWSTLRPSAAARIQRSL